MEPSHSLPELVAAAQANAKVLQDRISEARGSEAQDELRAATSELELASVDIFTAFEARMQHHFKRGPFSRKLKALLIKEGQADLAQRVHHFYLVVNVLKHGKGASYRELAGVSSAMFNVTSGDDAQSLIEINVPDFFDGLTATILEAYEFLENR